MYKKSSNPVSLFSFQDIITGLTGIMIIIVLIILLQLVESASKITKTVHHHSELKLLREKVLLMQQRKEFLNRKFSEIRKKEQNKQNEFSLLANAELHHRISSGTARLETLKSNLAQKNALLRSLEKQTEKNIQKKTALQRSIKESDFKLEELKKMAERIVVLRKEQKRLNHAIIRKEKTVHFEFSGFYDKTPVLVEVNSWGFRAKIHPDGKVVTFGSRYQKNSSPETHIYPLKQWLENIASSHYVVLLFRHHSLRFHDTICSTLGYSSYGRELLKDQEECF